jgi:suppressor of ftsI
VDVRFDEARRYVLANRIQALDHMLGSFHPEVDTLGMVRVSDSAAATARVAPFDELHRRADVTREIAPLLRQVARAPDHTLVLSMRTRGLPMSVSNMLTGINVPVDWNDGMPMMNWLATANEVTWVLRDPATGKENMDIAWRFAVGDVAKIHIVNDPATPHAMAHPIHVHGQRFLVVTRNGARVQNLVWKDTAVIPAGESADLLVEMSNLGQWMVHCHVAEHLGAGMMALFNVVARGSR